MLTSNHLYVEPQPAQGLFHVEITLHELIQRLGQRVVDLSRQSTRASTELAHHGPRAIGCTHRTALGLEAGPQHSSDCYSGVHTLAMTAVRSACTATPGETWSTDTTVPHIWVQCQLHATGHTVSPSNPWLLPACGPYLFTVLHHLALWDLGASHLLPPPFHCPVQEFLHLPLREHAGAPQQLVFIVIDCGERQEWQWTPTVGEAGQAPGHLPWVALTPDTCSSASPMDAASNGHSGKSQDALCR